jgi:hypothetical protein
MRAAKRFWLTILGYSLAVHAADSSLLCSFERPEELHSIHPSHAHVARLKNYATQGRYSLQIDFEAVERPEIEFSAAAIKSDWRPFGALAFDVQNPSDETLGFSIEVEDAAGAKTAAHTQIELSRRESESYAMALNSRSPLDMGMRGEPPIPGFRLLTEDHHPVDLARIAAFRIFLINPKRPRTLVIDNVRLAPGVSYEKIVDAFGQYTRQDWRGKSKSEGDFAKIREKEEAELTAHPTLPDRDEFGGWASGPQLEATGFFRTAQREGKWWLVTPSGHLFFSLGFNAITTAEGDTVVEGRERMFEWLPAAGDVLSGHYGSSREPSPVGLKIKLTQGRTFQFYTANLERKYGREWLEKWRSITLARLPAWGFNTIGNWSDPQLYAARRVPYTATVEVAGRFAEVPSGTDYWKRMPDPFDPAFAEAVDESARKAAGERSGDPGCIGYFVDNELSWGSMKNERSRDGLALGALSLDARSPAKQAFLEQLKKRYGSVEAINSAWGSRFTGWQMLLDKPFFPGDDLIEGMREDLSIFAKSFARQYFRTVRDALKKHDPNHLYLGTRFAGYTEESVQACAEFCDVMSFNIYRPRVEPSQWSFLDNLGKPAMVGEFHMGALDRGMFHTGLVSARDQAARAEMFTDYVFSVLDNPVFVGCHYFKYNDEPLTGRPGDGENYSIGFTTVIDSLYSEMIKAAKTVSGEMYKRHSR